MRSSRAASSGSAEQTRRRLSATKLVRSRRARVPRLRALRASHRNDLQRRPSRAICEQQVRIAMSSGSGSLSGGRKLHGPNVNKGAALITLFQSGRRAETDRKRQIATAKEHWTRLRERHVGASRFDPIGLDSFRVLPVRVRLAPLRSDLSPQLSVHPERPERAESSFETNCAGELSLWPARSA